MSTRWITTQRGIIACRTPVLERSHAMMVAQGLSQLPGVAHAEVVKGRGGVYVQWAPSDPQEQEQLYQSLMEKEVGKALAEMGQYQFFPTGKGGCAIFSKPDADGHRNAYLVSADLVCDCPHFQNRLNSVGLWCKHGIAWRLQRAKTGDSPVIDGSLVGGSASSVEVKTPSPPAEGANLQHTTALSEAEMSRRLAHDFD